MMDVVGKGGLDDDDDVDKHRQRTEDEGWSWATSGARICISVAALDCERVNLSTGI